MARGVVWCCDSTRVKDSSPQWITCICENREWSIAPNPASAHLQNSLTRQRDDVPGSCLSPPSRELYDTADHDCECADLQWGEQHHYDFLLLQEQPRSTSKRPSTPTPALYRPMRRPGKGIDPFLSGKAGLHQVGFNTISITISTSPRRPQPIPTDQHCRK